MTTESMKGGEALPDARVAELTERLERAVALLREWESYYCHYGFAPLQPTTAFLAAHQEPKP